MIVIVAGTIGLGSLVYLHPIATFEGIIAVLFISAGLADL